MKAGYHVTSPNDRKYNCIAHAAGDHERWWDNSPLPLPGYYWPKEASRSDGPNGLVSCFKTLGYEVCDNGDLEDGFEKVAIYVDGDSEWQHAAHQEANGEWSSKLGTSNDIRHKSPHCFGGSCYGDVMHFMKRPRSREESDGQEEA